MVSVLGGVVEARADRVQVQLRGLHLLGELLADRLLDPLHVDREQLRGDADVDHVLDQLAQLGLGAGRTPSACRTGQDRRPDRCAARSSFSDSS